MRANKGGRGREHANSLADLPRLRKTAASVKPSVRSDIATKAERSQTNSPAHKARKLSEDMAASKLDEAALSSERAPSKPANPSPAFAGLGRMLSSARKNTRHNMTGRARPSPPGAAADNKTPASAVNAEDSALFRRAVKSVQPIKDTRRAILPPTVSASSAMLRQRRERAVGVEHTALPQVSDQYSPAGTSQNDAAFVRRGHGPDLVKGLKRGKWPIGASLDLHGNTLEEARDRLDRFLQSCLTHHIKCVRIVHGKGYGSKDGEPVLKQTIRRWLTQMADVLAYAECSEADGGAGAVQVLLRTEHL